MIVIGGQLTVPYDQGHAMKPSQGVICPFLSVGSGKHRRPLRLFG